MPDSRLPTQPPATRVEPYAAQLHICAGATPDTVVVKMYGDIDLAAAPRVVDTLRAAVDVGVRRIVIDAADTTFIDAAGIRPILRLIDDHPDGVSVQITRPSVPVRRILQLTDMSTLIDGDTGREELTDVPQSCNAREISEPT